MGHVNADSLAAGMASGKLPERDTDNAPKRLQNELIAIVDDDENARVGLRALIESLGHRVAAFSSAEEYLASNVREITSCLILDVHLLGMSGPDLQAHLIADGCCPPTVFVTGRFEEKVRNRVIQAGALGYLSKPCNEKDLLDCIGQANKFVMHQNATHFRNRFWLESNPDTRSRLHKLLVAEEDKLGASCESLGLAAVLGQR